MSALASPADETSLSEISRAISSALPPDVLISVIKVSGLPSTPAVSRPVGENDRVLSRQLEPYQIRCRFPLRGGLAVSLPTVFCACLALGVCKSGC